MAAGGPGRERDRQDGHDAGRHRGGGAGDEAEDQEQTHLDKSLSGLSYESVTAPGQLRGGIAVIAPSASSATLPARPRSPVMPKYSQIVSSCSRRSGRVGS